MHQCSIWFCTQSAFAFRYRTGEQTNRGPVCVYVFNFIAVYFAFLVGFALFVALVLAVKGSLSEVIGGNGKTSSGFGIGGGGG